MSFLIKCLLRNIVFNITPFLFNGITKDTPQGIVGKVKNKNYMRY